MNMSTTNLEHSTPEFGLLVLSLLAIAMGGAGLLAAAGTIAVSPGSVAVSPTPWQLVVVLSGGIVGMVAAAFGLLLGIL